MLSVPAFALPERPTPADLAVWLDWEEDHGAGPGAVAVVRGLLDREPFDITEVDPEYLSLFSATTGHVWCRVARLAAWASQTEGCRLPGDLWARLGGYLERFPPHNWKTYPTPRDAWLALLAAAKEESC